MIKLLLDKQIFASSDAKFCCDTRNNSRYMQNFVHNLRNLSLDMVLSPKYVSRGDLHKWKKISMSKIDF